VKRVEYFKYGEPEVLRVNEVSKPKPSKGEILVKVMASSINAIDWKNRQGRFRYVSGLLKPRTKQGFDVAGLVEDTGYAISDIQTGDRVIGQLGNLQGGAFAQYVVLKNNQYCLTPPEISFLELAGIPLAATTAWQALFENAHLVSGAHVLINGGSSGVGHYAIQIAKAYGATVTAICSGKNFEFCRALGADTLIDYQKEDFTNKDAQYDIIFDVVNNKSLEQVKHIMKPDAIYIGTTPTPTLLWSILRSSLTSKKAKFVSVRPNTKALRDICRLMEEGRLKTKIDKIFSLSEVIEAHRYSELSRTRGKVIIQINE
jgi:NADPH:quinone reductase-like Zn-dependent oxidoreductase